MTREEVLALPVGALLTAGGLLHLICDERVDPVTGERMPLIMSWCPSWELFTAFGGRRAPLPNGFIIDFEKATRIA